MKTKLANGLVLTVYFTMNSAWACQSASSPPGNDYSQVSMGANLYALLTSVQKQSALEVTLERNPTFKEVARRAREKVGYSDLPQKPGFLVSSDGKMSPVQVGKEIDSKETIGATNILHKHKALPEQFELPFQTYRDYLVVVQGSLGGKPKRNLIIDTGTDPSVIDSRVAQELQMAGAVGKLAVHDQVVDAQQAVLPNVQIGTLRAEFFPVLIRDLGFLQKDLGIRIDAVIGLDVLSLSNFSINYTTKRIVFGVTPVSGPSVPFQSTPPWLTVRMEVDGASIDLLLDTAASGILLFQSRIRDRLPQLTRLGDRKSSNMGGDFRLQRVILARTKFGEMDFGQQNAFVVEDQEDESREFDGLLGPVALGLKQIAFDFQRHTLSWKK